MSVLLKSLGYEVKSEINKISSAYDLPWEFKRDKERQFRSENPNIKINIVLCVDYDYNYEPDLDNDTEVHNVRINDEPSLSLVRIDHATNEKKQMYANPFIVTVDIHLNIDGWLWTAYNALGGIIMEINDHGMVKDPEYIKQCLLETLEETLDEAQVKLARTQEKFNMEIG